MALSVPGARVILPAAGFLAGRPDSGTASSRDSGPGIVRTQAWNPGLRRYHNRRMRTGMPGYHPGVAAAVVQEYDGTKTRMRERTTREGTMPPQNIREHRSDTPRLSTTPGDGRDEIRVQYFTGCSGESENNNCPAPGITPYRYNLFRLHRPYCHSDNDGSIGDATRNFRVNTSHQPSNRRPDSAAMRQGGIGFSG